MPAQLAPISDPYPGPGPASGERKNTFFEKAPCLSISRSTEASTVHAAEEQPPEETIAETTDGASEPQTLEVSHSSYSKIYFGAAVILALSTAAFCYMATQEKEESMERPIFSIIAASQACMSLAFCKMSCTGVSATSNLQPHSHNVQPV